MDFQILFQQLEQFKSLPTQKRLNGMSSESFRGLQAFLSKYIDFLNSQQLQINKQSLAFFISKYPKVNTRAVVARRLGKFLLWYNYISHSDYREIYNMFKFEPPKWSNKALEVNKLKTILEGTREISRTEFSKTRNLLLCLFLIGTGARIKQVTDLRLKDIKEEEDCFKIKVKALKKVDGIHEPYEEKIINKDFKVGKFYFTIYFDKYLKLREQNDNEYFFITASNQQFKPEQVRSFFKTLSQKIGFKVTPHTIRHTIGTYIAQEVGILQANILLGHQDIKTTQIYIKKDIKKAIVPQIEG